MDLLARRLLVQDAWEWRHPPYEWNKTRIGSTRWSTIPPLALSQWETNFSSNPWWVWGKCLYLQSKYINLKQVCLCLFLVCVVEESSQRIGLGGYVISVVIVFALRVSPVINARSVLGDGWNERNNQYQLTRDNHFF